MIEDYAAAKFWLEAAVALCSGAAFIGVLVLSKLKANADAIHDVVRHQQSMEGRQAQLEGKVVQLEERVAALPTKDDVQQVNKSVSAMGREVSRNHEAVTRIGEQVGRILQFLIDQAAKP